MEASGTPPVGLLLGQEGLRETGTWCDKLSMWRRHLRLSDGRYVDIVEDYSASDTGARGRHPWTAFVLPLTKVNVLQTVHGYCGVAPLCLRAVLSRTVSSLPPRCVPGEMLPRRMLRWSSVPAVASCPSSPGPLACTP